MSELVAEPEANVAEEPVSHLEDLFNDGNQAEPEVTEEDGADEVVEETADEPEPLAQELESLRKQLKDAQTFIGRQSNDIGQLKKMLEANPQEAEDPNKFIDDFAAKPQETIKATLEQELARREQTRQMQEQAVSQMRQAVLSLDPEFESKFDGVKEWYKEKGAADDFVKALTPQHLYQNVDLAVALGEIQTLKSKLKEAMGKSGKVIEKLNRGGSTINSKASGTSSSSSEDALPFGSDVTKYTDAQLREALRKAT